MRNRVLLWISVLLLACPAALAETDDRHIPPEELLAGTALGLDPDPPAIVSSDEMMALSDDMRVIPDGRALAHFFNNLGVQLMQNGETAAAFYAIRRAITENDQSFAPAWDSLGTLYRRQGLGFHAEAAFLQALEIDRSDLTAMSNLTALYDRRGDPKLAARYRKKVRTHRKKNPYYRFQLARVAYAVEEYGLAIEHLKYAIRRHKDEDRFCALLGMVYLQMGDEEKSRRWMARAEEYAKSNSMKSIYSSKIDRLMSASR